MVAEENQVNEYVEGYFDGVAGRPKKFKGEIFRLEILRGKKIRSNEENRYYWGIVVALISECTGFTPDEVHEILKHQFLRKQVFYPTEGGVALGFDITKSTTELTTVEFEKYLSDIRQWASEVLSCYIPLPNEVTE